MAINFEELIKGADELAQAETQEAVHATLEGRKNGHRNEILDAVYGGAELSGPAFAMFKEFIKRINSGEYTDEKVAEVYERYSAGDYEGIYEEYEKKAIDIFDTDPERQKAFELWEYVFPELEYNHFGREQQKSPEDAELAISRRDTEAAAREVLA